MTFDVTFEQSEQRLIVDFAPTEQRLIVDFGEVKVVHGLPGGDNLADPSGIVPDMYIANTGDERGYRGWGITGYIPIEHGRTFSIAPAGLLEQIQYSAFYDSEKQYLRPVKWADFTANKIILLSPPAGAKFVRFSAVSRDVQNCEVYAIGKEG